MSALVLFGIVLICCSTVEELFSPGTVAFMLGNPHHGAQGTVVKIDPEHKGRIQLRFEVGEEPDLGQVMERQARATERCVVLWALWIISRHGDCRKSATRGDLC